MVDAALALAGMLAGLILYGVLRIYDRLQVDICRDAIFSYRDALFDLAVAGEIRFDARPYLVLRAEMNSMLRLAHRFTIWRLIFHHLARSTPHSRFIDRSVAALELVEDEKLRRSLRIHLDGARAALLNMVINRSPVAAALLVFCFFGYAARKQVSAIMPGMHRLLRRLNDKLKLLAVAWIETTIQNETALAPSGHREGFVLAN